jgi:hypothetical protein
LWIQYKNRKIFWNTASSKEENKDEVESESISKMHHKATKIAESGFKMTQIIAGIKNLVLPIA